MSNLLQAQYDTAINIFKNALNDYLKDKAEFMTLKEYVEVNAKFMRLKEYIEAQAADLKKTMIEATFFAGIEKHNTQLIDYAIDHNVNVDALKSCKTGLFLATRNIKENMVVISKILQAGADTLSVFSNRIDAVTGKDQRAIVINVLKISKFDAPLIPSSEIVKWLAVNADIKKAPADGAKFYTSKACYGELGGDALLNQLKSDLESVFDMVAQQQETARFEKLSKCPNDQHLVTLTQAQLVQLCTLVISHILNKGIAEVMMRNIVVKYAEIDTSDELTNDDVLVLDHPPAAANQNETTQPAQANENAAVNMLAPAPLVRSANHWVNTIGRVGPVAQSARQSGLVREKEVDAQETSSATPLLRQETHTGDPNSRKRGREDNARVGNNERDSQRRRIGGAVPAIPVAPSSKGLAPTPLQRMSNHWRNRDVGAGRASNQR